MARSGLFVVVVLLALFATGAWAGDKVILKDGTLIEGTITREHDGFIWLEHEVAGVKKVDLYRLEEVMVERDSKTPVLLPAPVPGAPKAAVITLGDEENGSVLGVYITEQNLRRMIPMLEEELGKDRTGVVVLRVHCNGGLKSPVQGISDVLFEEYGKRWRVAAWIDEALASGAMAVHGVDELYFTKQGVYGFPGCVFGPRPTGSENIEAGLMMMERISVRGNHNPFIMRAMQLQMPLSATIDFSGDVHWFADSTSGQILVNRGTEPLCFNAATAFQVKFSRGTVDTLGELNKAMGLSGLDWIGEREKGAWPICKAERWNIDTRKHTRSEEERANATFAEYQKQLAAARAGSTAERPGLVATARETLGRARSIVEANHNFSIVIFGKGEKEFEEFMEAQERLLSGLLE